MKPAKEKERIKLNPIFKQSSHKEERDGKGKAGILQLITFLSAVSIVQIIDFFFFLRRSPNY